MYNGIEKLDRTPCRSSGYIWSYDGVLTEVEASNLQRQAGVHPNGYGFYNYKVRNEITTWESQRSCD